jgi:hypothetical protein
MSQSHWDTVYPGGKGLKVIFSAHAFLQPCSERTPNSVDLDGQLVINLYILMFGQACSENVVGFQRMSIELNIFSRY